MEWMILPYKRYAQFSGRSQRKEYWMFGLFVAVVTVLLDGIFGGTYSVLAGFRTVPSVSGSLLGAIFTLGSLLPSLAVTVRRLHDTDRSGWWLLIGFVPLIGGLVLLYFMVSDGTPGANRYGEDPKGRGLYTVFN